MLKEILENINIKDFMKAQPQEYVQGMGVLLFIALLIVVGFCIVTYFQDESEIRVYREKALIEKVYGP